MKREQLETLLDEPATHAAVLPRSFNGQYSLGLVRDEAGTWALALELVEAGSSETRWVRLKGQQVKVLVSRHLSDIKPLSPVAI
jgi:hypothetical protein